MSESFEISYVVERKTYASEIRKRVFRSTRFRVTILLAILSGILFYLGGQSLLGFITIGAIGGGFVISYWIAPTRWLATAPYLTTPRTLRLTPERIHLDTPEVKSEFPWTNYIAWHETPGFFMLDLTKEGYGTVIPKSALTSAQQDQFRTWAAAKIPKFPKSLKRT
jgi:hypothetical protein